MAIFRSTGPINFDDVQEFFGQTRGSAFNLDSYYRGGGIVPSTGPNSGQTAIHQIAVDPSASSSGAVGTNEEFYIHLNGETEPPRRQLLYTFPGTIIYQEVTDTSTFFQTESTWDSRGLDTAFGGGRYYFSSQDDMDDFATFAMGRYNRTILSTTNQYFLGGGTEPGFVDILRVTQGSLVGEFEFVFLNHRTTQPSNVGVLRESGGIDTNPTGFVEGEEVTIEILSGNYPASTVQLDIPEDSISETITLTPNLLTDDAIQNDLLLQLQAIPAITDNWNISLQQRDIKVDNFTALDPQPTAVNATQSNVRFVFDGDQSSQPPVSYTHLTLPTILLV